MTLAHGGQPSREANRTFVGPASAALSLARTAFSDPRRAGEPPGYFYAVDLLRGVAAVSILFWHYSHFFTSGTRGLGHATRDDPLYRVFWLLYDHGGNAVQLFWLISGFTFSAVYLRRAVATRVFAAHRFARLYPLHLLTLLCVAALQIASGRLTGHPAIYADNDPAHFVDQLFLTSGWGPTIRFSFNGPIWTVSVELLVYGLFWLLLPRLFVRGLLAPTMLAVVSLGLSRFGPFAQILQGGFFFFGGCGLYPLYLACRHRGWARAAAAGLPMAAALVLLARLHAVGPGSALLCVALLLGAAFVDGDRLGPAAKRLMRWLGDNTYGTYLWHVPVQIVVLIVVERWGVSRALFLHPAFLLAYLVTVVVLARASFLLFEHPCRAWLNTRLAPQ